ncbi:fragile X mental retardation syndrome-related protein 1 like protein A [Ditylenchus destructor]|nr:fragile X mental retardation syndrome-related protein 1 like protein A [Ditylenchus destructor]
MEIEVKQVNGIFLKAKVENVSKEGINVVYFNDWAPLELASFDRCRQMMKKFKPVKSRFSLKVGESVEAFVKQPGSNVFAWQMGKIDCIKGPYAIVKCTEEPINKQIITLDRCRPAGQTTPLTFERYKSYSINIPEDMLDYFEDANNFEALFVVIKNIDVKYVKEKHSLQISTFSRLAMRCIEALAEAFLSDCQMKLGMEVVLSGLTKTPKYVEEFAIPDELLGLAIGKKGRNIEQARSTEGIYRIVDDKSRMAANGVCDFKIMAYSRDAAEEARRKLEFIFGVVPVRREFVQQIVGKGGENMQELVNQSGVIKVQIGVDGRALEDVSGPYVDFIFTGTRKSFEMAKTMMELQVMNLVVMSKLRARINALPMKAKNVQPVPKRNSKKKSNSQS